MTAKVKCLADADGFKKGSAYPVLAFGETVCMVENDDGKVVGVALTKINDDTQWELSLGGEDKRSAKDHAKAEKAEK